MLNVFRLSRVRCNSSRIALNFACSLRKDTSVATKLGAVVVEGIEEVTQALSAGWKARFVFVCAAAERRRDDSAVLCGGLPLMEAQRILAHFQDVLTSSRCPWTPQQCPIERGCFVLQPSQYRTLCLRGPSAPITAVLDVPDWLPGVRSTMDLTNAAATSSTNDQSLRDFLVQRLAPTDDLTSSSGEPLPLGRTNRRPLGIILDGVEKPGNIGAVFRAADSGGAAFVLLSSHRAAPSLLHPHALFASRGAVFSVPTWWHSNHNSLHEDVMAALASLEQLNPSVLLAVPPTSDCLGPDLCRGRLGDPLPLEEVRLDFDVARHPADGCMRKRRYSPVIVVMGSEAKGISTQWMTAVASAVPSVSPAEGVVRGSMVFIPQHGVIDSLNVASATAVLLHSLRLLDRLRCSEAFADSRVHP